MVNELIVPTLLLGGMFTFLGWVIKSQNAGDMINGFNEKKHDKKKISKIMGNNLLFIGISVIIVGIIGMFFKDVYAKYFRTIQVGTVIIILIKAAYETNKYGKITE